MEGVPKNRGHKFVRLGVPQPLGEVREFDPTRKPLVPVAAAFLRARPLLRGSGSFLLPPKEERRSTHTKLKLLRVGWVGKLLICVLKIRSRLSLTCSVL